jgi:hypothetical protein
MTCSKKEMNPRHGIGFLAFGLLMWLLPAMAPDRFPSPAFGGMNGSAMWLEGMGIIQILFGGTLLVRYCVWPWLLRSAAGTKAAGTAPAFAQPQPRHSGLRPVRVRANLPAVLRSA